MSDTCGKPVRDPPNRRIDPFGRARSDSEARVLEPTQGPVDGGGGHAGGVCDSAKGGGCVAGAGAEGEPGEGGQDARVVEGGFVGAPAAGTDAERAQESFGHVDDAGELGEVFVGAVLWGVPVEAGASHHRPLRTPLIPRPLIPVEAVQR